MHEGNGEVGGGPFGLHRDSWGRLVLTDPGGRQHVGLTPVRAFPISAPEESLALCDAEGREIWWVEALERGWPSPPSPGCWRRNWAGDSSCRSSTGS